MEVARILDTPVKKGPKPPGAPGAQLCAYVPTDSALPAFVHVQVESGSDAKIAFTVAKQAFKATLEKAPGPGKKSFYAGGGINTAYVLRGSTLVSVKYVNTGGDQAVIKSAVLELAQLALTRA